VRGAVLVALLFLPIGCSGLAQLDFTTLGRDMWQRPADVVEALELRPGDRVADLGAGEGYFVAHLSAAVGAEGRVYAVDVDAEVVSQLADHFAPDTPNVEAILGDTDDPMLPDASVDLVLIVNTYHHIENRPEYFRRLKKDLSPGGRVAIIEPNEDLGGVLRLALDAGHTSSAPVVEDEMRQAGYQVDTRGDFLPVQIFRVFVPDAELGSQSPAGSPSATAGQRVSSSAAVEVGSR
jgi:ubiquinone/menaquinone biosynthesis C-methylase UbiE